MEHTVTAEIYCQQLECLKTTLIQKRSVVINRKGVILQQDNTRSHIARLTQQNIRKIGSEVLSHPPYSPDVTHTDYYLFRFLQYILNWKKFENLEAIKSALIKFFRQKSISWYENGIKDLMDK